MEEEAAGVLATSLCLDGEDIENAASMFESSCCKFGGQGILAVLLEARNYTTKEDLLAYHKTHVSQILFRNGGKKTTVKLSGSEPIRP